MSSPDSASASSLSLLHRPRRLRRTEAIRRLVAIPIWEDCQV